MRSQRPDVIGRTKSPRESTGFRPAEETTTTARGRSPDLAAMGAGSVDPRTTGPGDPRTAPHRPALEAIARQVHQISALPQIALRVMEVANRPDSAVCDLKEVIEREPALSGRILRWVNSSACATRTQITSLQQAIAYLGLKQIRNLAVRASVGELFKKDAALGTYRRSELWRHMVSVGICARLIAIRRNVENPEDAFLAGLLHDIGIVLEDRYAHDDFRAVMQSLAGNKTLAAAERTHFGFDHTTLGEHVAKRWGFPDTLTAAIRFHHLSAGYVGEAVDVVRCVEVANWIATAGGIPSVGLSLVDLPKAALAALWLTRRDAETLADGLHKELVQNGGLFQV